MMNSILENTPGLENRLAGENLPKLTEKITSGILHFISDASPKVHVNPMNVVVKFQIERQQMIEDVLDKLSKRLHLRVLLFVRDEDRNYKAILYARPYRDEMYVIHLASTPLGILSDMNVVLYDSMESMQEDILNARNAAEGERLQWSTDVKIIKDFG